MRAAFVAVAMTAAAYPPLGVLAAFAVAVTVLLRATLTTGM